MKILGRELAPRLFQRAAVAVTGTLGSWFPMRALIQEPFWGAWQSNQSINAETAIQHPTAFRCVGLISSDIAKMGWRLVNETDDGVLESVKNSPYNRVLRRPNMAQTSKQFIEHWVTSLLECGDAFVLIQRDQRGVPVALYVLDHNRVQMIITPGGLVFYKIRKARTGIDGQDEESYTVRAADMIHDRLFSKNGVTGRSPLIQAAVAAKKGATILSVDLSFFQRMAKPSGYLTAPGTISKDTIERLKTDFKKGYTGQDTGDIPVLGDGLEFKPLTLSADASKSIDSYDQTSKIVCATFGVPEFKLFGNIPTYQNPAVLNHIYFSDALQHIVAGIECAIVAQFGMPNGYAVKFQTDQLIRMDAATRIKANGEAVKSGIMTRNEARAREGLAPMKGGDQLYRQMQDIPLDAPFDPAAAAAAPPANDNADEDEDDDAEGADETSALAAAALLDIEKELAL